MGISKKTLNAKLDKLNESISLMTHQWESINETNRKATILASNVAMSVTGDSSGVNQTEYNSTTYNQIQKMMLPTYMAWDYWIMINQWVDYWVNKYSDFKHNHKEEILTAIRLAIMYGLSCIDKETYTPYYIVNTKKEKEYIVIKADYMFNSTGISNKGENLYISDNIPTTTILKDKVVVFTWRFNNIGDFIWCMKQLLTDIYLKKIIECNSSHLTNKLFMKVKNLENLPFELATNTNPFSNVGVIISDEGIDINSEANSIMDKNKTIGDSHIVDLITAYKHHQEYYYNLFGRVITSSKQQTLSSDANLSVSSAENVAQEHNRRIVDSLEKLGIHIEVEDLSENNKPKNENADKEGEGQANTNMDNVEKKAD